jgi:hypothetical protein
MLIFVCVFCIPLLADLAILHPVTGEDISLLEISHPTGGLYRGGWPIPLSILLHPTGPIHTQSWLFMYKLMVAFLSLAEPLSFVP